MIQPLEVRYSDSARTDLDQIFWYIAVASSPKIALGYVQRLEVRCHKIGEAPRSGRPRGRFIYRFAHHLFRAIGSDLLYDPKSTGLDQQHFPPRPRLRGNHARRQSG